MNATQRQRIESLRGKGESYAAIAATLDIPVNTVKSFCQRANHNTVTARNPKNQRDDKCAHCGMQLTQTPGAKRKRFCSDKCRMAWWAAHPEAIRRKAVYHFVCPVCGAAFDSYGNSHRKYCSRVCFGMARRTSHESQ